MKRYITTSLLLYFISFSSIAQVLVITYSERNIVKEGAYDDAPPFIRNILVENDKNNKGYEFKLTHFKGKSVYRIANDIPEEEISIEGGTTITKINDHQKNYIMYKDQHQKEMVNQTAIFYRKFLVKSKLHDFNWTITNEKKQIGKYTCTKAITTVPLITSSKIAIAWYSEDLPINDGPREYWGLPGMILQVESVNDKGTSYITTAKTVMIHNNKAILTPPTKGKAVTREEFKNILEEKTNTPPTSLDFDKN